MVYGSRSTPASAGKKRPERSGAYLFLPDGPARPFAFNGLPKVYHSKGDLVEEYQVHYAELIHIVRIFKTQVGRWVVSVTRNHLFLLPFSKGGRSCLCVDAEYSGCSRT